MARGKQRIAEGYICNTNQPKSTRFIQRVFGSLQEEVEEGASSWSES